MIAALAVSQSCRDAGTAPVEDSGRQPVVEETAGRMSELEAENLRLQGLVEELQRDLAEARVKIDLVEMDAVEPAAGIATPDVNPEDLRGLQVVDVNRDMKVSVINGGSSSGIRAGMIFHVLRDEREIARLRVVEVRERIAGGLIEDINEGLLPEKGDRLVLSTKQD